MQDADQSEATGADAAEGAEEGRERRDFGKTAEGHVRRARKSLTDSDWQPDERASFFLASSKVYALLELADAIRGNGKQE